MIILRATFNYLNTVVLPLWLTLDYISDTVYFLDMAVQFITSEWIIFLIDHTYY